MSNEPYAPCIWMEQYVAFDLQEHFYIIQVYKNKNIVDLGHQRLLTTGPDSVWKPHSRHDRHAQAIDSPIHIYRH